VTRTAAPSSGHKSWGPKTTIVAGISWILPTRSWPRWQDRAVHQRQTSGLQQPTGSASQRLATEQTTAADRATAWPGRASDAEWRGIERPTERCIWRGRFGRSYDRDHRRREKNRGRGTWRGPRTVSPGYVMIKRTSISGGSTGASGQKTDQTYFSSGNGPARPGDGPLPSDDGVGPRSKGAAAPDEIVVPRPREPARMNSGR